MAETDGVISRFAIWRVNMALKSHWHGFANRFADKASRSSCESESANRVENHGGTAKAGCARKGNMVHSVAGNCPS